MDGLLKIFESLPITTTASGNHWMRPGGMGKQDTNQSRPLAIYSQILAGIRGQKLVKPMIKPYASFLETVPLETPAVTPKASEKYAEKSTSLIFLQALGLQIIPSKKKTNDWFWMHKNLRYLEPQGP